GPRFRGNDALAVIAGLTRQSIHLRKNILRRRWMRGSSPRMTGTTPVLSLHLVSPHSAQYPSFPQRISAPGVCTFASPTPNREVGGAPRNVRVLGGTPVGRIMTRYARRLRGALRPMTQRTTSRDNVRISTLISASVPIVSQSVVGFSPL